jgi:hypothetical protein
MSDRTLFRDGEIMLQLAGVWKRSGALARLPKASAPQAAASSMQPLVRGSSPFARGDFPVRRTARSPSPPSIAGVAIDATGRGRNRGAALPAGRQSNDTRW